MFIQTTTSCLAQAGRDTRLAIEYCLRSTECWSAGRTPDPLGALGIVSVWRDERLSSVHEILTTAGIPWAVAGGWALASDWRCEVSDNGALRPWHAGERLSLPIHEIHARAVSGAHPPLELLLNERDDTAWIYRRNPTVRRELNRAILVRNDIPFLAIAAAGADEQPEYPVS